ncbi:unnamed protein product [Trifolium pratense]|uniref:Uncharacterized protein n=3 Tax=Trifolium pratense TaxID=57577 RepID=A0ACB0LBX2_TRIPR|nr:unnamed protein product [Trifolium pratense]CAJ2666107.1 unnamed protein product [Trifolium pratense]
MVKVYMFIYTMIFFFSIFISIANTLGCQNHEDCRDHVCIEADTKPVCAFWIPAPTFIKPESGVCGCIGKITSIGQN